LIPGGNRRDLLVEVVLLFKYKLQAFLTEIELERNFDAEELQMYFYFGIGGGEIVWFL
jgi:hypothetical protein